MINNRTNQLFLEFVFIYDFINKTIQDYDIYISIIIVFLQKNLQKAKIYYVYSDGALEK